MALAMTDARSQASLDVMRFLNEVADDYPDAVSLASGRPADDFFDLDEWMHAVQRYRRHLATREGSDPAFVGRRLGQYGRTAGIINELIAEQLRRDEGILTTPDRIVVTAGCQEALALCIQALCSGPTDTLLVRNPTYIGATGAASLAGVDVIALDNRAGIDCASGLLDAIVLAERQGQRPRALYLVPQFDNPTGEVLSTHERRHILEICAANRIVVLEDNPYGMFHFEGGRDLPMAALDVHGCVIYLATYSKTLCPAVRVGCAVLPETLFGDAAASRALATGLTERKSFLTVNTSQLNQALVGGVLLAHEGSLERLAEPARALYRRNRDLMLASLERAFASSLVTWNRPRGGFFLSLDLPFPFDANDAVECAADYSVIVMPMSFFALDDSQRQRVRLSFSNVTPEQLEHGIASFARYVAVRIPGAFA